MAERYIERFPGLRLPLRVLLCFEVLLAVSFFIMIFLPAGPAPDGPAFITLGRHTYPGRKLGYLLFLAGISCLAVWSQTRHCKKVFFYPRSHVIATITAGSVFLAALYELKYVAATEIAIAIAISVAIICALTRPRSFYCVWARKLLFCIIAALVLIQVALAVHGTYDLSGQVRYPDAVSMMETHTACILTGPAQRLARGERLFQSVEPVYGLIFPAILGAVEKQLGILDWGTVISATAVAQSIFLILASAAYFAFARRSLPLCVLATALLLPSFSLQRCVYPHITALRYFGFLLAAVFLVFAGGKLREPFRSSAAGLVSGLSLLSNLETGISVSAGMVAYIIAVNRRGFRCCNALPLVSYALGLTVAVLFFEICYGLAFGYFPGFEGWWHHVLTVLNSASSGKATGGSLRFVPIFFFMVCHSVFVFIDCWRTKGARNSRNVRLSIASMLLVWFVYYFNYPMKEYMAAYWFLYLFLLIDLVQALLKRLALCSVSVKTIMLTVVTLVCIVSVLDYRPVLLSVKNTYIWDTNSKDKLSFVSGMYFPEAWIPEIVSRAQRIQRESKYGPVYYLTMNPVLIPSVSKVQSNIPFSEVLFSLYAPGATQELANYLRLHADKVFVDSPDLKLGGNATNRLCLDEIRILLNRDFVHERTEDGWQIWVKRVSGQQ